MDIPAFCDTCGAVFRSGISVDNATNITFVGNVAGPCPVCGGMGHIPDGVFDFVGKTIKVLSASKRTVEELSRLAKVLGEALENKQSPQQVATTLRKEAPELSRLADVLPRTRAELYSFLALIVAAITLLTQVGKDGDTTNISVNQTINQVFIETDQAAKPHEKAGIQERQKQKMGRNDACPCGSGKKHKKCCG